MLITLKMFRTDYIHNKYKYKNFFLLTFDLHFFWDFFWIFWHQNSENFVNLSHGMYTFKIKDA